MEDWRDVIYRSTTGWMNKCSKDIVEVEGNNQFLKNGYQANNTHTIEYWFIEEQNVHKMSIEKGYSRMTK